MQRESVVPGHQEGKEKENRREGKKKRQAAGMALNVTCNISNAHIPPTVHHRRIPIDFGFHLVLITYLGR